MTVEQLKISFPKLMEKLPEDMTQLRYILVIDENFNDVDSDEFDAIDPEDYNYLVYLTDLLQETVGKEIFETLPDRYAKHEIFSDFYASQEDLYGVMTTEGEEGIARAILGEIEQAL